MSPLKFITVSELKTNAKQILAEIKKSGSQMVVTVNGKPVVVLSPAREDQFAYQEEPKGKESKSRRKP